MPKHNLMQSSPKLALLLPPPTDAVVAMDAIVPASKERVQIYRANIDTSVPLTVGLYIHSGGWYAGSIEHEDFLARSVAENSGIILFSAECRLAPEDSYPIGLNDVCAAYEYISQGAAEHGRDSTERLVTGGLADGNLA